MSILSTCRIYKYRFLKENQKEEKELYRHDKKEELIMEVLLNIGVDLFNTVANIMMQIPAVESAVTTVGDISGMGVTSIIGLIFLGLIFD